MGSGHAETEIGTSGGEQETLRGGSIGGGLETRSSSEPHRGFSVAVDELESPGEASLDGGEFFM